MHMETPLDHSDPARLWESNANAWTQLARAGYDLYRDLLNAPAFMAMLPAVSGQTGIDVGCGEGHYARLLAKAGAQMTAFDVSPTFVRAAADLERTTPSGISYELASALALPFRDEVFDFAVACMVLMDIPAAERAMAEIFRIMKPGGFLQFSISHPAFDLPHRRNLRDESGRTYAFEVAGYFEEKTEVLEWIFGAAPAELKRALSPFRITVFRKTLAHWINDLITCGFAIECIDEPRPSDDIVADCAHLQDAQVLPYFMLIRARKPGQEKLTCEAK